MASRASHSCSGRHNARQSSHGNLTRPRVHSMRSQASLGKAMGTLTETSVARALDGPPETAVDFLFHESHPRDFIKEWKLKFVKVLKQ